MRHRQQRSFGHECRPLIRGSSNYKISWAVNRYCKGSRLRFPTKYSRTTDEAGARRFCRRWGLPWEGQ